MAIRFENSHGNVIKGFRAFGGGGPAISAVNSDLTIEDAHFDGVDQPFDIVGGRTTLSGTRIRNDPKTKGRAIGWTRPNGPPMPALCPQCQSVFPSKNYNIGSSRFYARDNEETCPHCGHEHALLSEGLFDLSEKAVRIISASNTTLTMLAAINGIAMQAVNQEITPQAAVTKLRKVHRGLATIVKSAIILGPAAAAYLALLISFATYQLHKQQTEIMGEQLTLQREAGDASEALLKQALRALSDNIVALEGGNESNDGSGRPSKERGAHPSSVKESKPKARTR